MSPLKKEDFLWLVAKNKKVRDWKNKGGLNMEMFSTADFDDEVIVKYQTIESLK